MGISLINHMAVLIVVAYVLTRTKLYSEVIIEKKLTLKNGIILSVIFGLFSIYGTMSGIKIFDATANIRDLGPAIAGLIAGPLVGVGAGLIGRSSSLLSGRSYLRSMFGSNAFCRTLRRHYISCKKEKDHHDNGRDHLCCSPRNLSHGARIFLGVFIQEKLARPGGSFNVQYFLWYLQTVWVLLFLFLLQGTL